MVIRGHFPKVESFWNQFGRFHDPWPPVAAQAARWLPWAPSRLWRLWSATGPWESHDRRGPGAYGGMSRSTLGSRKKPTGKLRFKLFWNRTDMHFSTGEKYLKEVDFFFCTVVEPSDKGPVHLSLASREVMQLSLSANYPSPYEDPSEVCRAELTQRLGLWWIYTVYKPTNNTWAPTCSSQRFWTMMTWAWLSGDASAEWSISWLHRWCFARKHQCFMLFPFARTIPESIQKRSTKNIIVGDTSQVYCKEHRHKTGWFYHV